MTAADVDKLVDESVAVADVDAMTLADFKAARIAPVKVAVNFSGGLQNDCWLVTRGRDYRVAYMPKAGYFSLVVVSSDIGPLDIGVHGGAVECFGAVQ